MKVSVSVEAIILGICLFFMMFGVGAAIDLTQLKSKFTKPKGLIIGFLCQYIILPFLSWFYCFIFDLQTVIAIAVIIVGSCPGGVISNYFCLLINADTELSVAMTAFSSIMSFAMIPLNGVIYIQYLWTAVSNDDSDGIVFDWFGMLLSIIWLISGLSAGLVIAHLHGTNPKKYTKKLVKICVSIGTFFLICIIIYGFYLNLISDYPIYEYGINDWAAPTLLCVSSWFLALLFAKLFGLQQRSAVAVAIETSNQNSSLALAILVLTLEDDPNGEQSYGIPIIYTILIYVVTPILMFIFYKMGWVDPGNRNKITDTHALMLLKEMEHASYNTNSVEVDQTATYDDRM